MDCKNCVRWDGKKCWNEGVCDFIQGCATCKHKTDKAYCQTIQHVDEHQCRGWKANV